MALDYLTENSFSAYPFRRTMAETATNAIKHDWFLDILFVSYSSELRSAYISRIRKPDASSVEITFSNAENSNPVTTVTLAGSSFVSHLENLSKPFHAHTDSSCAIKLVLGSGLISLAAFDQTYLAADTKLVASAFVLNAPKVHSLSFEHYVPNTSPSGPLYVIATEHSYSYPDVPRVQTRANSEFSKLSAAAGAWSAQRGQGAGLYDACGAKAGLLMTLNGVQPDSIGRMYLQGSNCYSINPLTAESQTEYAAHGYLTPYHIFEATNLTAVTSLDVVTVGNTLTVENHCKPKCAPENVKAFAHYLNRVTDGAAELNEIVYRTEQCRGLATHASNLLTVTAGDFCASNSPFDICSLYTCSGGTFIKNFHEFKTLQIFYSSVEVQSYTILEVLDEYNVLLNRPPHNSSLPKHPFRILDTGVFTNMNCASIAYNEEAAAKKRPYFKIKYTTNEAYSKSGVYTTYLTMSIGVYNPGTDNVDLHIEFTPTNLTQQGGFKIRRTGDISTVSTADFTLTCREYVFVEAVFGIACGEAGGDLNIVVTDVTSSNPNAPEQIGNDFNILNINGADCPGTVTGSDKLVRVIENNVPGFSDSISLDAAITDVQLFGDVPPWLTFVPNYSSHTIELGYDGSTAPATNTRRYSMFWRGTGPGITTVSKLLVDYVANCVILTPLETVYNATTPLTLSKTLVYDNDSPALQISATNMIKLSNDFPSDLTAYSYSLTPTNGTTALPTGLLFNTTTGKLTGQLDTGVAGGLTFDYLVTAHNPAGYATNPQTITLGTATTVLPTLAIAGGVTMFDVTNFDIYTPDTPLYDLVVTGHPIYSYTLTGTLPDGLTFSTVTGKIRGQVTELTNGSKTFSIAARNAYGVSSGLSLTVNYTVNQTPVITAPSSGASVLVGLTQVTTSGAPLFTVAATQAFGGTDNYAVGLTDTTRNHYIATGLPPGFSIDLYTGKVYGTITPTELPDPIPNDFSKTYTSKITAYNPVGSTYIYVAFVFTASSLPQITNVTDNLVINVKRDAEYTEAKPLYQLSLVGNYTSINVTGLPAGLTCTSTGAIVGKVLSVYDNLTPPPLAGRHPVTFSATNSAGTSTPVVAAVRVPICFVSPRSGVHYAAILNTTQDVVALTTSGVLAGDSVTVRLEGTLPTGLSLSEGVIKGTPTKLGASTLKAIAETATAGKAEITFSLEILLATYKISGHCQDGLGNPLYGITLTAGTNKGTATTDESGNFTFTNLIPGEYNIVPAKPGVVFVPVASAVTIKDTDIHIADPFKSDGPYRIVSGTVLDSSAVPVAGATISAGTSSATSDTAGNYDLHVPAFGAPPLIPKHPSYIFVPSALYLDDDATAENVDNPANRNKNFLAILGQSVTPPNITSVASGDRKLTVHFTVPFDDASIKYEYSTDGGLEYLSQLGPIIDRILGLSEELLVNFTVQSDPASTRYDFSTDGGKSYKSVTS